MNDNTFNNWENFLNPKKLKNNLIQTSIYIASYEIFKNSIIDKIKDFFTSHWKLNEETGEIDGIPSKSYKEKVLDLYPKDEFHACCLWFRNMNALTDEDMMDISMIRKYRNLVAHELPKFLAEKDTAVSSKYLNSLISIQDKLDKWWLKEIEIPTNPDFAQGSYNDIDFDKSFGSNTLLLSLLNTIFEGDDEYLQKLHKIFIDNWDKTV